MSASLPPDWRWAIDNPWLIVAELVFAAALIAAFWLYQRHR